ncbi:MAG: hypothetical protein ACR2GY_08455 [Phycisphaerales bacterium]
MKQSEHDFGIISIYSNSESSLAHTFHHANSSSRAIEVLDVVGSCGCVGVWVDGKRFDPRNPVLLPPQSTTSLLVRVANIQPGLNHESVTLHLSDGTRHVYSLRAEGLLQNAVRLVVSRIEAADGGKTTTIHARLMVVWQASSVPPTPDILVGEAIAVSSFDGWTEIEPASTELARSARFVASLTFDVPIGPEDVELRAVVGTLRAEGVMIAGGR